jgi:uncharacterized delta-60 repeat protein
MRNANSRITKATVAVAPLSNRPLLLVLFASVLCLPVSNRVHATGGDLDATFGNGGKVITDFMTPRDLAFAVAVQPDGKVIAAGTSGDAFSSTPGFENFALARYNPDGSLDSTFGSGGKVTTDFFGSGDQVNALALQPDGKIVAAGRANNQPIASDDFALARYNTDGSLDSSFGSGGKVTTDFGESSDTAKAIVLQSDGRIVVAGLVFRNGAPSTYNFAVARYRIDGTLDPSFGSGGKATTNFFGFLDQPSTVALQPDGKIVLAGLASTPSGAEDFALLRYNTNGTLDPTFGSGGKVITNFDDFFSNDEALAIAIQADGKIVAAGSTRADFALARYNSDGSLDSSFGSGGKAITSFFGIAGEIFNAAFQPDGKIIVAGVPDSDSANKDFALARYNADGGLDSSFGSGGKVSTDFFSNDDQPFAVTIQADGKIVAAGDTRNISTGSDFALARYNGDGPNFDICLQDDSSRDTFQINLTTGHYQFTNCSGGLIFAGTGGLIRKGSTINLQHYASDRRVIANIDGGVNKGTASVQILSQKTTFTIVDRNTANNTCSCP